MKRRTFVLSGLASAARAAVPPNLKITPVKVIVTNPARAPLANYVLVKIETNQAGLWGWGDCTCTGSELGVAKFLEEHMAPGLMGHNPMQLEDLVADLVFPAVLPLWFGRMPTFSEKVAALGTHQVIQALIKTSVLRRAKMPVSG